MLPPDVQKKINKEVKKWHASVGLAVPNNFKMKELSVWKRPLRWQWPPWKSQRDSK